MCTQNVLYKLTCHIFAANVAEYPILFRIKQLARMLLNLFGVAYADGACDRWFGDAADWALIATILKNRFRRRRLLCLCVNK